MVKTRSVSNSPVKRSAETLAIVTSKNDLPAAGPPLRVLIAPKGLSETARFISLRNPSTSNAQIFLFCPEKGLFEIKKISRPSIEPRSLLFAQSEISSDIPDCSLQEVSNGYVNKSAEYTTATPYDMCFLLLPVIFNCAKRDLFQSVDDMLDTMDANEQFRYVFDQGRTFIQDAMSKFCDCIEAGDDSMFRYSKQKTLELLISKARKACENGLPASLEDKFVSRMLEVPVLNIRREESSISLVESEKENIVVQLLDTPDSFESKSSVISAEPSVVFSEVSTTSTITTIAEESVSLEVKNLQRLRTAFKFVVHSYCSPAFAHSMEEALSSPQSGVNFAPLDSHLAHLYKVRTEVAASHSLSNFSQKRRNIEDDEEDEIRAEKKRKMEEDERKKKLLQSRAVRELSKVDVKGMKKMSDFFTKKPATAVKAKK